MQDYLQYLSPILPHFLHHAHMHTTSAVISHYSFFTFYGPHISISFSQLLLPLCYQFLLQASKAWLKIALQYRFWDN